MTSCRISVCLNYSCLFEIEFAFNSASRLIAKGVLLPQPLYPHALRFTGLGSISDENLLQQLAGDNVELRKELEKLLGRDTFETPPAAAAPATPTPTVAPTTTKH